MTAKEFTILPETVFSSLKKYGVFLATGVTLNYSKLTASHSTTVIWVMLIKKKCF